jgi:hypothetical protein
VDIIDNVTEYEEVEDCGGDALIGEVERRHKNASMQKEIA